MPSWLRSHCAEAAIVSVAGGLSVRHASRRRPGNRQSLTIGAIVLFLAIRHHLAGAVAARGGRLIDRVREALTRDGFSYLLAIRLVPAFPFWLVNLAAALSGMRLLPYVSATVLGIIPATFVYTSIGSGVGKVLAQGGAPDLSIIFLAQRPRPADRPRGALAVAGRLAPLEAFECLTSIWR